jgi:beta-lactamase class A
MKKILYLSLILLSFACSSPEPKTAPSDKEETAKTALVQQLEHLIAAHDGKVGVAVLGLEDRDTVLVHNDHHYPTLSVYKFPLAMAVFHAIDEGKLSLEQRVHIRQEDIRNTWSPLREQYPDGNVDITVRELLKYTVSQSDNNTCDVLFRLMGGTKNVDAYIHSLGVKQMAIAATEAEMSDWNVQYENWSEPLAMVQLRDILYTQHPLSDSGKALLLQLMTETENSPKRIVGQLPEGTVVAHKTGTSDTNEAGLTAAANDAGIITLPNGKHVAIAVFVSDTYKSAEENERLIAAISKAVFDHFMNN